MQNWRYDVVEVRNGIDIRVTGLLIMTALLAMTGALLRAELPKTSQGTWVIALGISGVLCLLALWLGLATCCYRLKVSRDGIEKTAWWGRRRLTWDRIASCRRVTCTEKDRQWMALLLLNEKETVLMETTPPFMGTLALGFAEEYEAALRLAERFLTEKLRYGMQHQQRLDEITDGSLDHDLHPYPEAPYTREHETVSRETLPNMQRL